MAKAKLKELLHKHQGKDHNLEKQKRLRKEAEKRKQKKVQEQKLNKSKEGEEDTNDTDLDEEWEDASESLHSEGGGIPLADESDSDSELDFQEASQEPSINGENENGVDGEEEVDDEEDEEEEEDDDDDDDDAESDVAYSDISSAGSALEDVVPHQRLTINNTAALERALKSFAIPRESLPFSAHQSITTSAPVKIPDVDDDLNRELAFYSQSLSAVEEARRLLLAEGVPFSRPDDYFAEMIKSDEHMDKIKAKMVEEASNKKAAAEARRQRDLRKFGKQVQQEKMKERAQAKNQMLEKVKLLKRKRQGEGLKTTGEDDLFDVALEDAVTSQKRDGARRRARGGEKGGTEAGRSAKRQKRDAKFGFGGKKRFKKSGDAISSADMNGYSVKKMKDSGRGKSKRLGKSRRATRAR